MNLYKFDHTVYRGDCLWDFYLFALKRFPVLLWYIPGQLFNGFLYLFQRISLTQFREKLYKCLAAIQNLDKLINDFWDSYEYKIKSWYKQDCCHSDIIYSAAPEFLIRPICERLGVHNVVASAVHPKTGKYSGKHLTPEKAVSIIKRDFHKGSVNCFYADRLDCEPLSHLAKQSFVVQDCHIIPWKSYRPAPRSFFRSVFLTRAFLAFVSLGLVNGTTCIVLSSLFSTVLPTNLAFIVGYLTSLVVTYTTNTLFIFCQKMSFHRYLRFCVSYIPNFLIQNLCVIIFYNTLGLHKIVSFTLSAVLGVPITFTILKLFAFKPVNKKKKKA